MLTPHLNSLWDSLQAMIKNLITRQKQAVERKVLIRKVQDDLTPSTSIERPSAVPEASSPPAALIVDLTNEIRITDLHAVAHGRFADIHRGEWAQAVEVGKTTQVCNVFPAPCFDPCLIFHRSLSNFSACGTYSPGRTPPDV